MKIGSLIFGVSLVVTAGLAIASNGSVPGYVYTPTSGSTVVKTAYGKCVHNAYWEPANGLEECGEAPPQFEPETPPKPEVVIESVTISDADTVLFNFDESMLTPAAKQKLTTFVDKFKESGDVTKITIDGYTDAIGTPDYNQKLSESRALAIKQFFVANGFNPDEIIAEGFGEKDAKVSVNCSKNLGDGSMVEINHLKSRLKKIHGATAKKKLQHQIAKLEMNRDKLIACAAPDRRVVLYIEHTQQVKKTIGASDASHPDPGKVGPSMPIEPSVDSDN